MTALGVDRAHLYAAFNEPAPEDGAERAAELMARRLAREPVAYLMGKREFYGVEIVVGPGVLIPRPDTETVVEETLRLIERIDAPRIADVGCGSGAIAVALAVTRADRERLRAGRRAPRPRTDGAQRRRERRLGPNPGHRERPVRRSPRARPCHRRQPSLRAVGRAPPPSIRRCVCSSRGRLSTVGTTAYRWSGGCSPRRAPVCIRGAPSSWRWTRDRSRRPPSLPLVASRRPRRGSFTISPDVNACSS